MPERNAIAIACAVVVGLLMALFLSVTRDDLQEIQPEDDDLWEGWDEEDLK